METLLCSNRELIQLLAPASVMLLEQTQLKTVGAVPEPDAGWRRGTCSGPDGESPDVLERRFPGIGTFRVPLARAVQMHVF